MTYLSRTTLGVSCCALLSLTSCAVQHAPGYEELTEQQPYQKIVATPFKMFGLAPWSYDLPDGRQIVIERTNGVSMSFDASFSMSLGEETLVCSTDPRGPGIPETRFGCWAPEDEVVTFWMAPGKNCPSPPTGNIETLTSPRCWSGPLITRTARYEVSYSTLESTNAPVNRITWTNAASGTPVQALSSITDMQMQLYPSPERSTSEADLLTLHAVALHYWHHTVYGD